MAKLYFRFGAMGSAKTLNLLAVAHNYRQQNKNILLIKPEIDTRFGTKQIKSRAGLEMTADILAKPGSFFTLRGEALSSPHKKTSSSEGIELSEFEDLSCILVDEAQFLSKSFVEELYTLSIKCKIPVIAYGLKTDFQNNLFDGSKRLLELSDTIEEIKTTCFYCKKKATNNIRLIGEKAIFEGEVVEIGADEKYRPCCKWCRENLKTH